MKKKMPPSIRKYIRHQKRLIRQRFFIPQEQEEEIKKLYERVSQMLSKGKEG